MNDVFGPMSSNYCNIFLVLSAIYLAITVLLAGSFLMSLTSKKIGLYHKVTMFGAFVTYLLSYITHRIFYNMCKKTA
jgi:hypothetical protein